MSQSSAPIFLRVTIAILIVVIGALAWWIQRDSGAGDRLASARTVPDFAPSLPASRPPEAARDAVAAGRAQPAEAVADGRVTTSEITAHVRTLNAPGATAEQDLQVLQSILAIYRKANNGGNPVAGLNEEFVDALRGKNEARLAVLPSDFPHINKGGQLVDRWGTPFYFHPISRDTLEIRSAGPDRKLWSPDDVFAGAE